jgi:transposase
MIIDPGVVGIDIAKHHLDIFDGAVGHGERIANSQQAISRKAGDWAKAGAFVLFEATGHYDWDIRQALAAAGVAFARVNPGRARDFARAAGFLAKTDQVDARMLAAMAQALRPPAEPAADPARERLAVLHKRRDQLVAMRKQERTRLTECRHSAIAASLQEHLDWLDQRIAELETDIATLIKASPTLAPTARLMRSLPGIGPVLAATLLALAPELGARSPKQIAALAGLAPLNRDSGRFRGQRSIAGGRKRLRDALYLAAVTASRSRTRLGAFYRALRNAGKAPKAAFIALARKLLIILNAMLRDGTPFRDLPAGTVQP